MGRIVATRQEVYHFGAPQGDTRFAPPELPVWADFNNGRIVYGIPDLEGAGFKIAFDTHGPAIDPDTRSEEHTSELQSLMRISYAVFCLKKKIININIKLKNTYNLKYKEEEQNYIQTCTHNTQHMPNNTDTA